MSYIYYSQKSSAPRRRSRKTTVNQISFHTRGPSVSQLPLLLVERRSLPDIRASVCRFTE